MYYSVGAEQNIRRAFLLWKKAARQNYILAQYSLANEEVGKDSAWAIQWLLQAASLGYVKAQYDLGKIYHKAQNFETASFFLGQAANQGYTKAQTALKKLQIDRENLRKTSEKM